MDIEIKPIDRVVGEIEMPGDKSISHRAVMIGALSDGKTIASNFLTAEDCLRTVEAFQKMGVEVDTSRKRLMINGVGLKGLKKPQGELYLGNSGTTMRIISGILAGQNFETVLTGDESLSKRPMARIIEPLAMMGAEIASINNNGCAPLKIKGKRLVSIRYKTRVASAQVKSCLLFAGLYAEGETIVEEPYKSRDHTERMLEYFGADIKMSDLVATIKPGTTRLRGKEFFIPGDISSAAFFIVLALMLEGSRLTIRSIGINPTRRKIIDVLLRMGANIKIENEKSGFEPICDLKIASSNLVGTTVGEEEIPQIIDEIPILAVAAAYASGTTQILGAKELRVKETDRILSMVGNLKETGVEIESKGGSIFIKGMKKRFSFKKDERMEAGVLDSFGDHRTAMAMCVLAAASDTACRIRDIDCISTSFPEFLDIFNYVKR